MSRPWAAGADHEAVRRFIEFKDNRRPNPERLLTLEGLFETALPGKAGRPLTEWFACPELLKTPETQRVFQEWCDGGTPGYTVSPRVFQKMIDRDEGDGLVALAPLPLLPTLPDTAPKRTLILDGLEIPGNAGTILRSAEGAGFDLVIHLRRRHRLTHPKMAHASLGACFYLTQFDAEDPASLYAWLSDRGVQIHLADSKEASEVRAETQQNAVPPLALVLGGEKQGIHTDWYALPHTSLKIPMRGRIDSLNVACAATVLLYELS